MYPHIPKRREPLHPHRSKSRGLPGTTLSATEREELVWDLTNTGMSFYDNLLKNPDYFKRAKGIEGNITWMSPENYMRLSAYVHGGPVSREYDMLVNELVNQYAHRMEAGDRFPIPVIDLDVDLQEGRNRAAAAQSMSYKQIPVLIVKRVGELARTVPATERGELLVNYTGGPQRFAFPEGLDGEIRNFAAHQWVILDTLRNREVIRKSKQWTIARQQPAHLKRSSGLLPATTFTANQIFTRAKDLFGTTTSPDEAGYILPDGTMLDFSGRHYEPSAPISGPFRERMADHREIAFAWPEDDSPGGFDAMAQVMNWGAIRFSTFHETVVVNLVKPPTEAQKRTIDRALRLNPEAVLIVEVDNPELGQIDYQEFTRPFTNWRAFVERTVVTRAPVTTPSAHLRIRRA